MVSQSPEAPMMRAKKTLVFLASAVFVIITLFISPVGTKMREESWKLVGTGDCAGRDIGSSKGFLPIDEWAKRGRTAVCWDNVYYKNSAEPGRVFCTYKNLHWSKCSGGTNVGVMYAGVED